MKKTVTILLAMILLASCSRYGVYRKPNTQNKKAYHCNKI